jgi:sodium/proline symporter
MLAGTATVLIWHNLLAPLGGVFGIYELLPAFIISALAIVIGSLLSKPPSDAVLYEFDHYMDITPEDEAQAQITSIEVDKAKAEAITQ